MSNSAFENGFEAETMLVDMKTNKIPADKIEAIFAKKAQPSVFQGCGVDRQH